MISRKTKITLLILNLGSAVLNFILPEHAVINIIAGSTNLIVSVYIIYKIFLDKKRNLEE